MKNKKPIFVVLLSAFAATGLLAQIDSSVDPDQPAMRPHWPDSAYRLAWSDEFDGAKLDTNKWHYRTGKRQVKD